jgi:predicted membrane channel-forming protein YqfA (hemolysin III family)
MGGLPVNPTWRKPAGIFLILVLIAAWSVAVATAADQIEGAPWPLRALFFLVAGIAWILPLKPLIRWMELGKWRE